MARALYPGSFDPVTGGHMDLIARALELFDAVTVAVAGNIGKQPLFTLDERLEMLQDALPASEKLEVVSFGGLVVDYCKEHGHKVILRGLRTVSDFEYEYQMALTNRHLNDAVETVFVMPSVEFSFVSSSLIKDIVRNGGSVSAFVPSAIEARMQKKLLNAK